MKAFLESSFAYEERIVTKEVSLVPIAEKDLERMRLWRNRENCNETFIDRSLITKEAQIKWYEKYKADAQDRMFMIVWEKKPVGVIALYHIDYEQGEAEFGRLLIGDFEARGKKLGIKATKALCDYAFEKLGLKKITLEVFKDNKPAKNIYEKIGFEVSDEKIKQDKTLMLMTLIKKESVK